MIWIIQYLPFILFSILNNSYTKRSTNFTKNTQESWYEIVYKMLTVNKHLSINKKPFYVFENIKLQRKQ